MVTVPASQLISPITIACPRSSKTTIGRNGFGEVPASLDENEGQPADHGGLPLADDERGEETETC